MWKVKHFATFEAFNNWIERNKNKYRIERIFVNNKPYSIEYKPLIEL